MKPFRLLVAAAAMLSLTACTPMMMRQLGISPDSDQGFNASLVTIPDSRNARVFIINNRVVVDQEPIRIQRGSELVVRWLLERGSAYTFPANGLGDFTAMPGTPSLSRQPDCGALPGSENKVFRCTFARTEARAQYKYSIRVLRDGTMLEALDPTVMME